MSLYKIHIRLLTDDEPIVFTHTVEAINEAAARFIADDLATWANQGMGTTIVDRVEILEVGDDTEPDIDDYIFEEFEDLMLTTNIKSSPEDH